MCVLSPTCFKMNAAMSSRDSLASIAHVHGYREWSNFAGKPYALAVPRNSTSTGWHELLILL